MTATVSPSRPTAPRAAEPVRLRRRLAVGATGLLAAALPLMWGTNALVELLTGTQADHRFHQLTGQGLLLAALWLGWVVPLVRSGLRGRAPSTAAALHAGAFLAATAVAGVLSTTGGSRAVAVITVVTAALLWAALPVRPALRGLRVDLDPVLAPVALLSAALVTPYVLDQSGLQDAFGDEHAELAHYFDMAWVTAALVALALVAAVVPAARRLALPATASLAWVGATGLLLAEDGTWSTAAAVLGGAGVVLAALRLRADRSAQSGS